MIRGRQGTRHTEQTKSARKGEIERERVIASHIKG
jgi:hypothetical protein